MITIIIYPNLKGNIIENRFKQLIQLFEKSDKYKELLNIIVINNLNEIKEDYNIIICNRCNEDILKLNKPVIICERHDSCTVSHTTRLEHINNDSVKAIFKEYIFIDKDKYKTYFYQNRYHFHLLSGITTNRITNFSDNNIEKIKCVTWNLKQYSNVCSNSMNYFKNNNLPKTIDIFMICNNQYTKPTLCDHRKKGIGILKKIAEKHNLKIVTDNVSKKEYNRKILESKICIAPYGLGSRVALDQYGILAKAIVIKPRVDYLTSSPDIYNGKMFEFCERDWSDLEQIIAFLLKNYNNYDTILEKRRSILLEYDEEYYMDKFYENILPYTNL